MSRSPETLYLDLLKKTLSFTLWPEPPEALSLFNHDRPPLKRAVVSVLSSLLDRASVELVKRKTVSDAEREEGRTWPAYADTMIGLRRLDNLQQCIETVLREGVEGDLIETGVWRGGACIFMRGVLAAYGVKDRRVYVADSFEGLPEPNVALHPADLGDAHHQLRFLAVSEEEVRHNFERYGLLDDQVVFVKGWFNESLPKANIGPLSILRLDGDMYSSTIDAISVLYPKLSPGGFCIVDDCALPGCRQAIHDYRSAQDIQADMIDIDFTARYWRKPFGAIGKARSAIQSWMRSRANI